MHNPPSPPLPQMDPLPVNPAPSPPPWDWTDFLDFDDQFSIPFEYHSTPDFPPIPANSPPDNRVRKRDPRLVCSNFLAGRVPCACPELDAMAEEEDRGSGKKRARTVNGGMARCQVPDCGVDISELKGYHRRHRVCLQCANANNVVLDGMNKRYCQQCGKFHILSDFDEGKRSCRRKLERHNNRRRRKPADSKETVETEAQQALSFDDGGGCDNETGKESQPAQGVTLVESDSHVSVLCSADGSQNIPSDSIVSINASGETLIEEKDKFTHSPSYLDNKSSFSSMCPTGRISFKLYDWNPAEFPRRLRHQIFQWLASMPVELEGYIRPGCTILTVFIAMPKFMWVKLFEDPVVYIQNLLASGKMLSGRGNFLLYLNNMIFHVIKDGTSVIKVKVEGQAPKLHYVHPACFEAGKPMEFVACGSNLLQPKFRFLLSFAGTYLKYDVCVQPPFDATANLDHQLLKIYVPHMERNLFGPAFIEVENESGLSNFIPILIGDKEICSEMKTMQQKVYTSPRSRGSNFAVASSSCEASSLRQKETSEFILHVAWLLKEPLLGNVELVLNSSQFRRFNFLLDFLVQNESTVILDRVLYYMNIVLNNSLATGVADDTDMRLCQRKINRARDILCQNLQKKVSSIVLVSDLVPKEENLNQSSENNMLSVVPVTNQDKEVTERRRLDAMVGLESASVPLLNRDVVMRVNLGKEQHVWPRKPCSIFFTSTMSTSRPIIFVIAAAAVCFGICSVVLHPQKVGHLATTIHRCLFYNP